MRAVDVLVADGSSEEALPLRLDALRGLARRSGVADGRLFATPYAAAITVECVLVALLLLPWSGTFATLAWLGAHLCAALLAARACTLAGSAEDTERTLADAQAFVFCAVFAVTLPLVGALGVAATLRLLRAAPDEKTERTAVPRTARTARLPLASPRAALPSPRPERRGLAEQLAFPHGERDPYRRVVAAAAGAERGAVDALRDALEHPDESVRLSAYRAIDARMNALTERIATLEAIARADAEDANGARALVAAAACHVELLALEEREPAARARRLDAARSALTRALALVPDDPDARLLEGRVALLDDDVDGAETAFERARDHGAPAELVNPYRAEAAFARRDFAGVRALLGEIEPAFAAHAPLDRLCGYWT